MGDLVTLESVSKSFEIRAGVFGRSRTLHAVDEVNLSLSANSVTGVVGESGCGKSTLARLTLGLLQPTKGRVNFDGRNIAALPARELRTLRRRMQMVFQDPYSSINPRFSIKDAIAEPFAVQGIALRSTELERQVLRLLDLVGLDRQTASVYPHQLSGGQRQRVGIARAIALEPALVVLDEPTASLDVSIQAQIIRLLEQLKAELGLTYLFISHDLGLVQYFCDSIVVMYLGRVVERLPAASATPKHPYTRALLSSCFVPDPVKRKQVPARSGEMPSPLMLHRGCSYADRCERVLERCRQVRPVEVVVTPTHSVACHNPL